MTREDAIAIIRKEYLCVDRDCDIERSCGKCDLLMPSKEPILEAYKMAIKALEQEPCDDAISRQAVIDKIKEVCFSREQEWVDFRVSQGSNGQRDFLINYIEQLSPVNPQEPKQVELEGDGYADGELVYDYGKCPSCGWQFEDGDKDWEEPFCCRCGQKLKWFKESEDIKNE